MADLNFSIGLVTFTINGAGQIAFNPTDGVFVEKLFNAFESLDKMQEQYVDTISKMTNKRQIFAFIEGRDAEVRKTINDAFGSDVCTPIFGEMSVYALAGGLPVWTNFLLAVMDEIDTAFARERKATNPRIKKYTEKYSG